jgi:hypothetical protein
MNDTQPWYLSRGVWGALVSVLATLAAALSHNKVQILPADQDQIVTLILTLAGALGSAVALIGRLMATKQISSAPANPNLKGPGP